MGPCYFYKRSILAFLIILGCFDKMVGFAPLSLPFSYIILDVITMCRIWNVFVKKIFIREHLHKPTDIPFLNIVTQFCIRGRLTRRSLSTLAATRVFWWWIEECLHKWVALNDYDGTCRLPNNKPPWTNRRIPPVASHHRYVYSDLKNQPHMQQGKAKFVGQWILFKREGISCHETPLATPTRRLTL